MVGRSESLCLRYEFRSDSSAARSLRAQAVPYDLNVLLLLRPLSVCFADVSSPPHTPPTEVYCMEGAEIQGPRVRSRAR